MDVVVCEANHFNFEDIEKLTPQAALEELMRRKVAAANAVLAETKPGDLVMLEGPVIRSPMEKMKEVLSKVKPAWVEVMVRNTDFYPDIAEFAKQHGRRVALLDTGLNSGFGYLFKKLPLNDQNDSAHDEAWLVMEHKRNAVMESRVKAKNPKLVIAACQHVRWLVHVVQPTKFVNAEGKTYLMDEIRQGAFNAYRKKLEGVERMNKLRKERRSRRNAELAQRKAARC